MGRKKINPLDIKTPYTVGVKKRIIINFENKINTLGLNRSIVIQSLMEEFIKN